MTAGTWPDVPAARKLSDLYDRLLACYGVQAWWPADTAFEVVVGAVLTQNAAWGNVEKALNNLRAAGRLALTEILQLELTELAQLIRPSGYFNLKAQRLRNLCLYLDDAGGLEHLGDQPTALLRTQLLAVHGIGPETADDILLYALDRPVFVIDTYTRRLLQRYGLCRGDESYEVLRAAFEAALPADVAMYQQYHALIVEHAKAVCRKAPCCAGCGLASRCAYAM